MKVLRRTILVAAALSTALLGVANPAHAAEKVHEINERFEFGPSTDWNSCAPEPVQLTIFGRIHIVGKMWETSPGAGYFHFQLNQHTEGVDAQGNRYVGNVTSRSSGTFDNWTGTTVSDLRVMLNSQGSGDNLYLRDKVRVVIDYPNFDVEVLKHELECRG